MYLTSVIYLGNPNQAVSYIPLACSSPMLCKVMVHKYPMKGRSCGVAEEAGEKTGELDGKYIEVSSVILIGRHPSTHLYMYMLEHVVYHLFSI
jgi:hypothetical protein